MLRARLVTACFLLLAACSGGPADPAAAVAAGDYPALKQFLNAKESKTRADALSALTQAAQNPEAQKLLANAINAANEDVWKGAVAALLEKAVAGEAWAVSAYKDALNASRQEVQVEAISALQKKGGAATKPFLAEFAELLTDTDEPVVTAAADALKALGEDGWPVVKEALAAPRPSVRQKGAIVAGTMMETTSKHLDDVVARFLVEDAEDVLPELEKVLANAEGATFAPLMKGLASVDDAKKRGAIYDSLNSDPLAKVVVEVKPSADPKKPNKPSPRCTEILASIDTVADVGAKAFDNAADKGERDRPGLLIYNCITGEFKGKPETAAAQKKLQEIAQGASNPAGKRGFALYVLCSGEAPGLDKEGKAWFKDAQKKESDDKVKAALKASGC